MLHIAELAIRTVRSVKLVVGSTLGFALGSVPGSVEGAAVTDGSTEADGEGSGLLPPQATNENARKTDKTATSKILSFVFMCYIPPNL